MKEDNPNRVPAGSSKGGQFAPKDGGSPGDKTDDDKSKKTNDILKLDNDRIKNVKNNYLRSPQLSDEGDALGQQAFSGASAFRHMSNSEADELEKALETSDHKKSDEMFLKAISKDEKLLKNFETHAEEVQAYNEALEDRFNKTEKMHRFISIHELENYAETGKFESKGSDFVSFSIENQSKFFGQRDVNISVDAGTLRSNSKPLKYSPFPRYNSTENEKQDSEKHSQFAIETEVRLKSNADIPPNMDIVVNAYVTAEDEKDMIDKFGKLGNLTFKNRIRD